VVFRENVDSGRTVELNATIPHGSPAQLFDSRRNIQQNHCPVADHPSAHIWLNHIWQAWVISIALVDFFLPSGDLRMQKCQA
jgi:hypothetical protein